jgi:ubiquinone/menaquinone biosynthesis C-methylase UbiE
MTEPRIDRGALATVYGDGVDVYDNIWSPVIRPGAVSVIDAMNIADAKRVLDVGAGTGALTEHLREVAPSATILSLDPSQAMLRYARERRGVCAVVADAGALPSPESSVDAVLLAYVLFHLLDPVAALREAARVVRAGGRVGTVTWASETQPLASQIWDQALEDLCVPTLRAHGNHDGLATADAIAALLARAGLRVIDVWIHELEHTFTPEGFWSLRTGYGSNRARLAALDTSSRGEILFEARRRLEPLAPDDYTFHGTVVCSVSEKPA